MAKVKDGQKDNVSLFQPSKILDNSFRKNQHALQRYEQTNAFANSRINGSREKRLYGWNYPDIINRKFTVNMPIDFN